MRRYRTVIIVALLGIIPMLAGVFVMRDLLPVGQPERVEPQAAVAAPPEPPPVEEPKLRMVLAAARDLPVGTLLGEDDVTELGIEEGSVRRGHIALDSQGVASVPYGHVVREALAQGAPLTRQALVGPRQRGFLAAVLKPGMRAMTVRLGAGTRHSGLVDPGDRVDVVLTAEASAGGLHNVLSRTILEDVRVLAVDRSIGSAAAPGGGREEVQRTEIVTATLEVLPEQTGLLALGEFEGELALAVRPLAAGGAQSAGTGPVEARTLLSLPQAEPEEDEPELQTTVRVIRGSEVTGVAFDADAKPVKFENAELDTTP